MAEKKERKGKGCIWKMGLALKQKNEESGKFEAICNCNVDPANPDLTCNKKLTMPDGSTSSLRQHIKSKHPTEWVQLLTEEKNKAAQASAQQLEADQILQEIEGNPDELKEDLTQVILTTYDIFKLFLLFLLFLLTYVNSGIIFVTFVVSFGCTFGCTFVIFDNFQYFHIIFVTFVNLR